jgi:putative addiction module component (TIGR02574 family)
MSAQLDITKLSPAERLSLISELWDSIADEDAPITPSQSAELQRRLSSFEDDKKQAVSWSSVKAELAARKP